MSYFVLIISVLIGALLVFFWRPSEKFTRLLLAFSGAYFLAITILHLLPEAYENTNNSTTTGILILTGIIVQFILESFSKGAEHGHIHVHNSKNKLPILLFISLCIHAFTEGLPIHHANENLIWGIVVHKIPIAIVLTSFLLNSDHSKKSIYIYLLVFSMMSPLGILIDEQTNLLENIQHEVTAVVIGIFLHISTIILFESTENHKFNLQKFIAIILGVLLTIFSL